MQRFGRVLSTNRGVSACECFEALGKSSASPFQSGKETEEVIPVIQQRPRLTGMVKPREAAHDADVAKACRKEIEALTARGARLRRILIDAELKGILAKRSETARAKLGKEEADRARRKAADELHLPCDDQGHVQIPDAQIQYVDEAGNPGRVNVEVASDHYREASVKAKSAGGFSMHGGKGGQAPNTRTSLSSPGGGGGRRGGGRSSGDPASVEI